LFLFAGRAKESPGSHWGDACRRLRSCEWCSCEVTACGHGPLPPPCRMPRNAIVCPLVGSGARARGTGPNGRNRAERPPRGRWADSIRFREPGTFLPTGMPFCRCLSRRQSIFLVGRSARAIFDGLAEIILPKTSREDFDYAHARRTATPMGLRTRTMGMLLRWPLAKTKPPRRN
jgi:hypothetical protein